MGVCNRRDFLKMSAAAAMSSPLAALANAQTTWSDESIAKFIQDTKVYVTSAFWNDSKIAAKMHRAKYDAVCVPGVGIDKDGTLYVNPRTKEAVVKDKPLLYIIQNHPEGGDWDAKLAQAFIDLPEKRLKKELAQFEDGIILDLESMTGEMNKTYHTFVEKVARVYDRPLIVSLHAKLRNAGGLQGLGKQMNYKAICSSADAVDYMTLDAWPGNPEYPIASLDFFRDTLKTLFEEKIDASKVIASIPTYIKVSFLNKDGSYSERDTESGPEKQMLEKLDELTFELEKEGQFVTDYDGKRVRGWKMTDAAYKARFDLLKSKGIDKVALWYGGVFLENTQDLRQPLGKLRINRICRYA